MTKLFLLGKPDKKRRGIILSGVANSGKSTIARFAAKIWSTHSLRQTFSTFEEKMDKDETNKQILLIDEANIFSIFSKKKLHDTKSLLEGSGMSISNKFAHTFTGF
jgi:hypothetical protein